MDEPYCTKCGRSIPADSEVWDERCPVDGCLHRPQPESADEREGATS